jgi:pyruvate/2-oxoglutarate dehydrogenase complex dihydrolipoamide acyltransferase (E2) component
MRRLAFLLFLPLLTGCSGSTWDYLTSFGSDADDTPEVAAAAAPDQASAPAPAAPAAAQGAPNAFCMAVARQDATENGFDTATQQRVLVRNYRQCVATFGNSVPK